MDPYKIICPTHSALCFKAADELLKLVNKAANKGREFNIALAGGSTPKKLYQLLASPTYQNVIPWGVLRFFFGDERCVPPDDPASNFNMINGALLNHINIDPLRVHRIQGELEPKQAAEAYHLILKNFLPQTSEGIPIFDLIILGLGPDGHIASLFPHTDAINVSNRFATEVWVEKLNSWRITLTYPVINSARNVWIFVSGEPKQRIVDKVFNQPSAATPLPVERVKPTGQLSWFLDNAAAGLITQ